MNCDDYYAPPSIFKNAPSLQILCLQNISKRLVPCVPDACENIVLPKQVDVLQRFYSSELIEILSHTGVLQDSCLDFVLNKYSSHINMKLLNTCSQDAVIHRFAEVGYILQTVNIEVGPLNDEPLEKSIEFVNKVVCHLTNVTILRIVEKCSNTTLKIIADSCPKLEELYLENCTITSQGVINFCSETDNSFKSKFTNLRILSLQHVLADIDGIFLLQYIPSLEHLHFCNIPKLLLVYFGGSRNSGNTRNFNLTTLKMDMSNYDFLTIEDFSLINSMCPRLKTVSAGCYTQAHINALSGFVGIENLTIFCSDRVTTSPNCNELLKTIGASLKEIHLLLGTYSTSVLIQNCPNIESLELIKPTFQLIADDQNTAVMHKLVELRLGLGWTFNNAGVQSLCKLFDSCSNLESLYLDTCNFNETATLLNFIKKSCLNFLSVEDCKIQLDLLEEIIRTTPSLQTLCIDCCHFDEKSIKTLGDISKSMGKFVNICWREDDEHDDD